MINDYNKYMAEKYAKINAKLKPCPCCSGVAKMWEDMMSPLVRIECGKCGIGTRKTIMDYKYNISIIERDGAIGIIVSRGTHEIYRNMSNKNETDVSIKTDNINLEMNGFGVRKFSVSDIYYMEKEENKL